METAAQKYVPLRLTTSQTTNKTNTSAKDLWDDHSIKETDTIYSESLILCRK